jgi:hypothetical protein
MLDRIVGCQLRWAAHAGIPVEAYTRTLRGNIFGGQLCQETREEYIRGKGHELEGKRAHMKALYSSSALVVNVFDYWRRENRIQDIARCCGAEGTVTGMSFEKTHPIKGIDGTPPHLDVEFAAAVPLAIESKFTETYRRTTRRPLRKTNLDIYLGHDEIWDSMARLKDLARDIVQQSTGKTEFEYLDVPQLIKHVLGLSCSYGGQFFLLCTWYKINSNEAKQHEQELARFSGKINDEISFQTLTYQDLFNRIRQLPDVDSAYLEYLERRYFSVS